jgi:protocatechuate 3,4-dioxygenase beta subunit
MDAWLASHARPERVKVKSQSATDGAFRFEFWPPPPFGFDLRLQAAGHATWSRYWSELQPGATVDLGTLVLPAGTLLRGRVVDTDGVPVKTEVRFTRSGPGAVAAGCVPTDVVYAKEDGTFTGRSQLTAGEYGIQVPHREVDRPRTLTLHGEPELVVEVVLRKIDPASVLAGEVVDEQGQPVASAMVTIWPPMSGSGWINSTDRQGHFRLVRPEHAEDQVSLQVTREGFELLTTPEKFAWGRDDLRLSMRRGAGLAVRVVAAEGGTAVEDFAVYCLPTAGVMSSDDGRPRVQGRHEGGRVTIPGLQRVPHQVLVAPKDDALAASSVTMVDIGESGQSITVALQPKARRTVRVQRAGGSPVAGVTVQLTDRMGKPAAEPAVVLTLANWIHTGGSKVLRIDEAVTDARGEAVLAGPAHAPVAIELPGPGHVPMVLDDVRLDLAEPLVITLDTGARLRGRITPPEALAELARLAGMAPDQGEQRNGEPVATIRLSRGEGRTLDEFPAAQKPAPVGADGAFELDGIPPGLWRVRVEHQQKVEENMSLGTGESAGEMSLQASETTEMTIDLSALLPGDLDALVLHNGKPLINTRVRMVAQASWASATTDAEGRCHATLRPGEYTLQWPRELGVRRWIQLTAPEHVAVVRGRTASATFDLRSATVRVRLLDAQGKPVAGVPIELRDAAGAQRRMLQATAADGTVEEELEVEPMQASVLPRRLQSNEAQMEVYRNNARAADPFAGLRVALGTVLAVQGTTATVELRLPADW